MKISFNDVSFRYDKEDVLKNINIEFNKSEIVFVMGHTGSGKSTLVQHINGLLLPSKGEVTINVCDKTFNFKKNTKIKNINELRKEIGVVFQFPEYQLFETSVIKDVMFGPMNFYRNEKKAKELAVKALNDMGIDESYYDKSPFDLSGGEKRKVAIAGVLASNPSIIILDEPTSGLDFSSSEEIMKLLVKFKEENKLVIVISHDTDLCYEYASRVIIMEQGRVIKDSNLDEAFNDNGILKRAGLIKPFALRVKEVIKHE